MFIWKYLRVFTERVEKNVYKRKNNNPNETCIIDNINTLYCVNDYIRGKKRGSTKEVGEIRDDNVRAKSLKYRTYSRSTRLSLT